MAQTRLTTDDLREISRQVSGIAAAYSAIADEAEATGIEGFDARGIDTLYKMLGRVEGNVNSLQKSLRDAKRESSRNSLSKSNRQPAARPPLAIPGVAAASQMPEDVPATGEETVVGGRKKKAAKRKQPAKISAGARSAKKKQA